MKGGRVRMMKEHGLRTAWAAYWLLIPGRGGSLPSFNTSVSIPDSSPVPVFFSVSEVPLTLTRTDPFLQY